MFNLSFGLSVYTCRPLGCLYVCAGHPQREEIHEALLTIANKGFHPIYVNLTFFELSPNKIHAIKSINTTENLTNYIIHILHNISLNHIPHKVEMFVRNYNTTKHQYDQCTLLGSSNCLMGSSGNPAINLGDLDFFWTHSNTWRLARLASQQTRTTGWTHRWHKDYNPLDPSQRWLESRLPKSLLKHYVNYYD